MTRSVEQADALTAAGRFADAADLLIRASAAGDADALFLLALWRIDGTIVRRNLPAARALMARAEQGGHAEAALIHAYFMAAGIGGAPDWPAAVSLVRRVADQQPVASEQLALLDRMALDDDGAPLSLPPLRPLSERPRVWTVRGFLTPKECDYLSRRAEPQLQPSMVVDPRTQQLIPHPIRTSEGMMFGVTQEDLVVHAINRRIASITGTSATQGEALQILRYRGAAEYRPHLDALPAESNQRIATALVYLTGDYEGGETQFVRTGLSFKGGCGDLLFFSNVKADGSIDQDAQHAGLPVRRGTKIIASRWIRQRTVVFPPPQPVTGSRFD